MAEGYGLARNELESCGQQLAVCEHHDGGPTLPIQRWALCLATVGGRVKGLTVAIAPNPARVARARSFHPPGTVVPRALPWNRGPRGATWGVAVPRGRAALVGGLPGHLSVMADKGTAPTGAGGRCWTLLGEVGYRPDQAMLVARPRDSSIAPSLS